MSASSERQLYEAWVELLSWMREYAQAKGVRFEKEADFPDFIYRMERPYDLPTTIMTASLSDGSVSPSFSPTSPPGTPRSSASASAFPGPTSTSTPTTSRERAWSRGRSPSPRSASSPWRTGRGRPWPSPSPPGPPRGPGPPGGGGGRPGGWGEAFSHGPGGGLLGRVLPPLREGGGRGRAPSSPPRLPRPPLP